MLYILLLNLIIAATADPDFGFESSIRGSGSFGVSADASDVQTTYSFDHPHLDSFDHLTPDYVHVPSDSFSHLSSNAFGPLSHKQSFGQQHNIHVAEPAKTYGVPAVAHAISDSYGPPPIKPTYGVPDSYGPPPVKSSYSDTDSYIPPAESYGAHDIPPSYAGHVLLEHKPCKPKTVVDTQYKTKYLEIPVRETVVQSSYIPTTLYEKVTETQYETKLVPQYIPKYITETKYIENIVTDTKHHTVVSTHLQNVYHTETQVRSTHVTETGFVTQYETRYQPQYLTETKLEPIRETKVIYKTKVLYQTKYLDNGPYRGELPKSYGHGAVTVNVGVGKPPENVIHPFTPGEVISVDLHDDVKSHSPSVITHANIPNLSHSHLSQHGANAFGISEGKFNTFLNKIHFSDFNQHHSAPNSGLTTSLDSISNVGHNLKPVSNLHDVHGIGEREKLPLAEDSLEQKLEHPSLSGIHSFYTPPSHLGGKTAGFNSQAHLKSVSSIPHRPGIGSLPLFNGIAPQSHLASLPSDEKSLEHPSLQLTKEDLDRNPELMTELSKLMESIHDESLALGAKLSDGTAEGLVEVLKNAAHGSIPHGSLSNTHGGIHPPSFGLDAATLKSIQSHGLPHGLAGGVSLPRDEKSFNEAISILNNLDRDALRQINARLPGEGALFENSVVTSVSLPDKSVIAAGSSHRKRDAAKSRSKSIVINTANSPKYGQLRYR